MRSTTRTSSSCEEDSECQEVQHQHLWKDLELTKPYLETEAMADIKNSLGEDSVKLEPLDEYMVMDIERQVQKTWP